MLGVVMLSVVMLSVVMLSVVMLSVVMPSGIAPTVICSKCHYAWGRYSECCYAGGHFAYRRL